jgi:TM2 domain/zinc-ribbon domain
MPRYVGCPSCGKTIEDDAVVCPHCGKSPSDHPPGRPRTDGYVDEFTLMADMTDQQRMLFQQRMGSVRKDPTTGVLLAIFLGWLGGHHFWMGNTLAGVLYLLFFWTGIPFLISLVEAFFMPGRVRLFNMGRARKIADQIKMLPVPR